MAQEAQETQEEDRRQESAVILLQSPNGFAYQHRANVPNIAHPDKLSLFGGFVEDGESPREALDREIQQESRGTLDPGTMAITALWSPRPRPVIIAGRPRLITVNVFHGTISSAPFEVNHESQGYQIFAEHMFLNGNRPARMTHFAFRATRRFLRERQ